MILQLAAAAVAKQKQLLSGTRSMIIALESISCALTRDPPRFHIYSLLASPLLQTCIHRDICTPEVVEPAR